MKILEKHFKKLLIILCLIASPSHADFRHFNEWTTSEKGLFLAYNTITYIDHRQTRVGLRNGYVEGNDWLYGKNPHKDKSVAINLAISGLMYYGIGKHSANELNAGILGAVIGRTAVVVHNDSIGVSWRVAF